jgi:hypothetical protein
MKSLLTLLFLLPLLLNAQVSNKKKAFIMMQSATQQTDTVYQWLTENARAFWDMTDGVDKTGNGYDLVGTTGAFTQVPDYKTFYSYDGTTKPMAYCTSGNIPLLPAGHQALLRGSHEFHIVILSGRHFSMQYIFGADETTHVYFAQILNTGKLRFQFRSRASNIAIIDTNDAHFTGEGANSRRAYSQKYIRIRIDYDLNTFGMWINGSKVAVTITGDTNIALWDPNYYNGANPFGIGGANAFNGTSGFQGTYFRNVGFCAVTDLLTDSEADAVTDYLMNRQGTDMKVTSPDNPVFSTKSRLTIGVKMPTPPVGPVDVTISGTYMTTINKTLTVQECTDGYAFSFFANDATHGFEPFDITIAGVGYNSVIIPAYVSEDTEEANTKWTPLITVLDGVTNWRYELPTFTDATAKRLALANDIFRDTGGVYPSGAPYSIQTGVPDGNGILLNNANSATKVRLKFRENDSQGYYWEGQVGWSENVNPSSVLVIDYLGHGEPGHDLMYNAIMDAGYDYANCVMASTTNNPGFTTFFDHNEMLTSGVNQAGYDFRRLFIFDKFRALDYILSQKTYTKIILTGISGGAMMGGLLAALESRIDKSFLFRGISFQSEPYGENDAEGGPLRLYNNLNNLTYGTLDNTIICESLRNHSRLDWMALAASNGECHLINHILDIGRAGYYSDIVESKLKTKAIQLGGVFFNHHFTDPSTAVHGYYSVDDIAYLLAHIP